jgi:alcohol dehydrogenase (cytochrome c)
VETPVLFDANLDGKPGKYLAQAARNGFFFVLDRTNGKSIRTAPFVGTDWAKGIDAKGQPIPDPKKEPTVDGSLINIPGGGGTNWMAPSFDPQTNLFYVNATKGYSLAFLTDTDEKPEGYGGSARGLWSQHVLEAIDVKTGQPRWTHPYSAVANAGLGGPGILTTAGNLLFTGDYAGNLIAFDPASGAILWHFRMTQSLTNGPMTYILDGKQYLIVGAGDTLFAFELLP